MSTALENAEDISRLRNFPAVERIQFWNHAFSASFLCGRFWKSLDGLRQALAIVALSEARVLRRIPAIVVERRAPEESGVRHHARGDRAHFCRMTADGPASFRRYPQVTRIDKLDVFRRFLQPQREGALGKICTILESCVARLHVRFFLDGVVFWRVRRRSWRNTSRGISSVAIRAVQVHRFRWMHRRLIRRSVARDAADGFF